MTIRTDLTNLLMLLGNIDADIDDIASGVPGVAERYVRRGQLRLRDAHSFLQMAVGAMPDVSASTDTTERAG